MLEVFTWRPKISLPSWINFSTRHGSCVHRSYLCKHHMHSTWTGSSNTDRKKNKNHQITLPEGRIGFSSLDVADEEEPKYQIRNPYELTNAITITDDKYKDCFLLHSTIPAQPPDDCLQSIHGTEASILQQPHPIGHCISADAKMSKGFADLLSQRIPGLRDTCRRTNLLTGQAVPFWDQTSNRYIYNLVTKTKFSEKPNLPTLSLTLEEMKSHARLYGYRPLQFLKLDADLIRWTGRRL